MVAKGLMNMLKGLGWCVTCPEAFTDFAHLDPGAAGAKYKHVKNLEFVAKVTQHVHEQVRDR